MYEHSQPGNNPYNIRVVSNSWGAGGGIYEPGDTISEAINKLTYENNVVCVFAAGNSYGDGNTIQSGNYANTPAAVCVAATGRDGTYVTEFSSKGRWDWTDTYPDVGAPGHHIDSTAARRTQISAMTQQGDSNPYYLSISGTSMATPHVSGLVALLWQAAPSMRVSDVRQDAGVVNLTSDGDYIVIGPEELAEDDERWSEVYAEWNERLDTRIHEAEVILKLTTDMIPPEGEGDPERNGQTSNWIPDWTVPGYVGDRPHDWAQGYGLINVRRAVGLALTLEKIRWDYPEATVYDAYSVFEDIFEDKEVVKATDQLRSSWSGEWARFNEQSTNPTNLVFEANQTRMVYVPAGAEQVRVSMSWPVLDITKRIVGTLGFMIDTDSNGGWDYQSSTSPDLDGTRTETISVSGNDGQYWTF
ncbi:MAG: S8 family serine peptidase, partial [Thermoplasmata archaeon]|nr:S8 family serine peptidase [Thermoplasmata archaeon]NIS12541.1 S8 family serine peptidase [Thermoplasmata archaeon]NIS20459.1 S8 family serine peptidase [Thermoplasmata archaeon]NIT77818.1 S8 family serine peptidase [Thermoplasmata archaeon]NIU49549.1 S8 family serine peptidase [Thermoplasmata archaeon]